MGCCCANFQNDNVEQVYTKKYSSQEVNPKPKEGNNSSKNESLKNSRVQLVENKQNVNVGQTLKLQGNEHFKNKKYKEAINCYQKALASSKIDTSYYTNLALAYKANHQYDESINAIDQMVNKSSLKGAENTDIYRKGLLTKARSLMIQVKEYCLGGKFNVSENHKHLSCINSALTILEDLFIGYKASNQVSDFLTTAKKLKQFMTDQIIPKSSEQHLILYLQKRFAQQNGKTFSDEHSKVSLYFESEGQILKELAETVERIKADAIEEQKDFLQDPITYEALLDAVIVPSGTTYNKKTLIEHFKNNGYNDPITHQIFKIGEQVVVQNFNIKTYANQSRRRITLDDLYLLKY